MTVLFRVIAVAWVVLVVSTCVALSYDANYVYPPSRPALLAPPACDLGEVLITNGGTVHQGIICNTPLGKQIIGHAR